MHRTPEQEEADRRVGDLLRRARQARRWSQRRLVAELRASGRPGWAQSRVSRIENGDRPLKFVEATALADVLELDEDEQAQLHPHLNWARDAAAELAECRDVKDDEPAQNAQPDDTDPSIRLGLQRLRSLCDQLVERGVPGWDYEIVRPRAEVGPGELALYLAMATVELQAGLAQHG
jgi:transcriptional regulator with XRE-family HTH domain